MRNQQSRLIDPAQVTRDRIARDLGQKTQRELIRVDTKGAFYLDPAQSIEVREDAGLILAESLAINFTGTGVKVTQADRDTVDVTIGPVTANIPTVTLLAAAGSTASGSVIEGCDISGRFQIVPNGAGIAAGNIIQINFGVSLANNSYGMWLTPASSAARSLAGNIGGTSRSTANVTIVTPTALTAGLTYQWDWGIVERA